MKSALLLLSASLCFPSIFMAAQTTAGPKRPTAVTKAAPQSVPPFSGSWVYDPKRSVVTNRIPGRSSAVIDYDGKTWRYTHRHQSSPDVQPEAWQIALTVDSPKYQVQRGEEITFRTRIHRQGRDLLLEQYGVTSRGEKMRNSTRYALSDDGKTLTETETSVSRLGPVKNKYVLVREGDHSISDQQ
jgi:hypothetical protein